MSARTKRARNALNRIDTRFLRRILLPLSIGALAACTGASQVRNEEQTPQRAVAPAATPPLQSSSGKAAAREPLVVEGTGKLVGEPRTVQPAATQTGEGYQLSFVDTEISSVVASVIGDGLGLPYAVDPQVKGIMTLQAARPLTRDEVLPALESALNVHGVALVEASGTYQAVPMKDAARRVSRLRGPGQAGVGFGVRIVPLKYVSAADMEKTLRPFTPDGGILRVDEGRNLLILAGTSQDLAAMQDVVDTFDVNWLAGMSFALYPVEYVDAKTLADELATVFADTRSPIANLVRLVPLSRLNSLMVVTHEPGYLREVEAWIKRLDIGAPTPGRRIYVYDVQNGKADDLAESLSKILSITVESAVGASSRQDEADISFGSTTAGNSFRSMPGSGASVQASRETSSGRAPATVSGEPSSSTPGALKIVPNVENNALLIYATPSEFSLIEGALRRLDIVPIQVLIEASLAEVSLTDDLRFGLQWSFAGGDGPVVLSETANGTVNQRFPGFSYLFIGRPDIRAVLNALETMTDVNVISSPKLMVLNNREAQLQIGDQVPIVVQSAVSTVDETAPIVNSVQLRDTGVILRITPRVNRSGLVMLDVAQEVSDVVATTTSNIDSPTIQQRRITSSIAVRTGETIALGGLIRESKSRSRSGLPLATKIPLIGGLFGSTGRNDRRTELIVLITPRVIRSQAESDALMDELHEQFRGLRRSLPQWTNKQPETKDSVASEPAATNTSSNPAVAKP